MPCRLVIGAAVCKLWWFKGGVGLDLEAGCGMEPTTTTICHILGVYRTEGRKADRTAGRQAGNIEERVGTCPCVCVWIGGKQPGRFEGSGGGGWLGGFST